MWSPEMMQIRDRYLALMHRFEELEARIVKLEAYVAARRKEDALMARAIGNLPEGPD